MPLDKNQKIEVEKRIHRSAAFQNLFRSANGELALEEIDELTGYKEDAFNSDPYKHAFNAGMRQVSVLIHNLLERKLDAEDKTERKQE